MFLLTVGLGVYFTSCIGVCTILDDILSIDSFSINNVSFKCSTNIDSDCLVFFSNSYTYQVVPAIILFNFYLAYCL